MRLNYPEAKFVGAHSGDALIDWCSCADVMVMPSHSEVFSMAVLECLALGIPVATHDAMGQRVIIRDGVNGYIDKDIATAAKKSLTLSREACRESVRQYSWETSARKFLTSLAEVREGDNRRLARV